MSLLILDVGSSSVRALLMDEELHPIIGALARRDYTFTYQPSGAAAVGAAMLRGLLEACIDEVMRHPASSAIRAVGMATFVGNLLGVDADNQPLTPVYTYADSRSADDLKTLADEMDTTAAYHRTGCPHHTAYHPARLRWLARTQPETFEQVTTWLDFGTYCYRQWFDVSDVPCSYSIGSWSGLLNRHDLTWDDVWLEALQLSRDALPPLADYDDVQTGLSADYAERWPALRDVPFYLAVGDGAAANIGSGAVDSGHAALTLGTTAALRVIRHAPPVPDVPAGLWGYRVSADRHLIGGALTEGGSVYAWAKRTFGLSDTEIIFGLSNREPDTHGLTVLPLLAGERSTGFAPDATGTIHGLTLVTEPLDIVQAVMESVGLRLRLIAESLLDEHVTIYAGGGAMDNVVWRKMITDALGRPLHVLNEVEVTARGIAVMIADGALIKPPRVREIIQPDTGATAIYQSALERQRRLYTQIYN